MTKYIPYVLVGIALILGFYLKSYLDISNDALTKNEEQVSEKKINDQFETLLVYPKKNLLKDFSLFDQNNKAFTESEFKGKWNLIFTGYTNCPDVCPNTLNQMAQLYKQMDRETQKRFQVIFFSVDPERDTPNHLKQYLDFFHEDFVGITGEKNQIDGLIKSLGGIYSLNKSEGEFYTVDHSARIFIVSPRAERYGIFKGDTIKAKDKSQLVNELTNLSAD